LNYKQLKNVRNKEIVLSDLLLLTNSEKTVDRYCRPIIKYWVCI